MFNYNSIPKIFIFITMANFTILFFTNYFIFYQINIFLILFICYMCWIFNCRVTAQIDIINEEIDGNNLVINNNLRINNLYKLSTNIVYFYKIITPVKLNTDEICSICLEKMDDYNTNAICKLKCNHLFHINCIKKSIISNNYKCPNCRIQL